jgi:hypothetical protein
MRIHFAPSASILFLALASCLDQSDYQLDEVQVNPSLALPLVNGELTIRDLISDADSANIKVYPDGLVYLAYEQDLQSQGIKELFTLENRSTSRSFILPGVTLPPSNSDFRSDSLTFELDLQLSPEQLSEIVLKAGQLAFTTNVFPANSTLDYEIRVSIPQFISRSTNKSLGFAAKGSGNIDLSSYTAQLVSNKFNIKLVLVIKKHANPIVIANGTSINIQLTFRSLDFSSIKGFFGFQTVSLPPQTVKLGDFQDAFGDAEVSFADPKISLTVTNEYGVPTNIDFTKLVARKNTETLAVVLSPANPVALNAPATIGKTAVTVVNITNVNDLLDFSPTEFYYEAQAKVNDGVTSGVNFLTDTSKLNLKMGIEIPLYGSASNIQVRDTVDVDWSDVDQSQIEKASLKLKLLNQLPLDGSIQFVLTDVNYKPIETLLTSDQTSIIKGSRVNASGELQAAGVYDNSIEISSAKLARVFEASHIIIQATFSTSQNGTGTFPDVKFKADYSLSVEVGILAQLKLNVKL